MDPQQRMALEAAYLALENGKTENEQSLLPLSSIIFTPTNL